MIFKMSAQDFSMLSKFIEKKAKGSDLKIRLDREQQLEISLVLDNGEEAKINFFSEEVQSFAKIIRSRNLGDEL